MLTDVRFTRLINLHQLSLWCKLHRFFLMEAMKKVFFLRKSGDSGTLREVSVSSHASFYAKKYSKTMEKGSAAAANGHVGSVAIGEDSFSFFLFWFFFLFFFFRLVSSVSSVSSVFSVFFVLFRFGNGHSVIGENELTVSPSWTPVKWFSQNWMREPPSLAAKCCRSSWM